MEAKEWYKLRNDRTNRVEEVTLDSSARKIGVYIHPESITRYSNQVLALLTLNMLARWCRRISIECIEVECVIPGRAGGFRDLLNATVCEADPFGEFIFEQVSAEKCSIIVSLGGDSNKFSASFWADSNGWIAGFGFGLPPSVVHGDDKNPLGACLSACLVNSTVFRTYLNLQTVVPFSKWYSLYDFKSDSLVGNLQSPPVPSVTELGTIWQIGSGAVGSSFDYLLSLMQVSGRIDLIDFDHISIPNTSSSLLFRAEDAFAESLKINACRNVLLLSKTLNAIPFEGDLDQFIRTGHIESGYPDTVLCFANERNVWSTLQYNCPPVVMHATTSKNWGTNFGRHIPFEEWCIVCRFGLQQLESTPTCATGTIQNVEGEEEILGILPFLAPVAAVQILAELIKMSMKTDYPVNKNFIQFSLKHNNPEFQAQFLKRKSDCPVCSGQTLGEYPARFFASMHYHKFVILQPSNEAKSAG